MLEPQRARTGVATGLRAAPPGGPAVRPADAGVLRGARGERLHLLAGQLYFGRDPASVHTLLGSCVAVTLWHPGARIGGICHYLLPRRERAAGAPRDARYGDEAIELLVEAIGRAGTRCADYQARLYGGADTMPGRDGVSMNIGERNIELGWTLIDRHGFELIDVDVGDTVPRNVELWLADGAVKMRRGAGVAPVPVAAR